MPQAEALSDDALTTVEAVARELGIEPDTEPRLAGWVNDASALIVDWCGRPFARRDGHVETLPGTGDPYLQLRLLPVLSVTEIAYRGVSLPSTAFELVDPLAGSLLSVNGSTAWDVVSFTGVGVSPIAGTERALYRVTYSGGYVTPAQAAEGGAFEGEPVTLPRSVQRACVEAVVGLKARRGQNGDIASESALGYSVSYRGTNDEGGSSGLSAAVRAKLDRYRLDVFV